MTNFKKIVIENTFDFTSAAIIIAIARTIDPDLKTVLVDEISESELKDPQIICVSKHFDDNKLNFNSVDSFIDSAILVLCIEAKIPETDQVNFEKHIKKQLNTKRLAFAINPLASLTNEYRVDLLTAAIFLRNIIKGIINQFNSVFYVQS